MACGREASNVRVLPRLVVFFFLTSLLAACAGQMPQGPARAGYDAGRGHIQLAQAQFEDDEDLEFQDLFPGDGLEIEEDYDPLEIPNRFMFAFNEALDVMILRPAAATYRFLMPQLVQDSVRNFVRNLRAPVDFANHLFQGKDEQAADVLARFGINTILGVGGLFDVADHGFDLKYHEEDFGQTLGFYGMEPGPYLVLPLFGPSSLRDAFGRGIDSVLDPWSYVLNFYDVENDREILLGRQGAFGVDLRARNIETLEDLKRDSVDFYARLRSLYLQKRKADINDGEDDDAQSAASPVTDVINNE